MFKSSSGEISREMIGRTKPQKDGQEESSSAFSQAIKLQKDFVLKGTSQKKVKSWLSYRCKDEHILNILFDSYDEGTRQMFYPAQGKRQGSTNLYGVQECLENCK